MSPTRRAVVSLAAVVLTVVVLATAPAVAKYGPPTGGGGGGHTDVQGNNLSFPVIAVDQFDIASVASPAFGVEYAGTYPGLTPEEVLWLDENGPWYPQKTEGNTWQSDFLSASSEEVTFVDWGDNIESVNPKLRRPFRLEVTLYKQLETPMAAFTMAVLEYPSSADELQGTNGTQYSSAYATVISDRPNFVVQYLGTSLPEITAEEWTGTKWATYPTVPLTFAPELNVGGKYIFGASEGGWKPATVGYYRLTFYIPGGSGVSLSSATIGDFADLAGPTGESGENEGVATPVVEPSLNLTYVDVHVVGGSGGPGR